MDKLLDSLAMQALALSDAEATAVVVRSSRGLELGIAPALPTSETEHWARGSAVVGECLRSARVARAPTSSDAAMEIAVPILARDGHVLGAIALAGRDRQELGEDIVARVALVAATVALVLERQAELGGSNGGNLFAPLVGSELRFRAFMRALPAVAWIKDPSGTYRYINDLFEKLWSVDEATVVGKDDFQLFSESVARDVLASDELVRRSGTVFRTEEHVPTPDGADHVWLTTKFPITSNGEVHVGGVAFDITERITAELELRESRARLQASEDDLRRTLQNLAEGVVIHRLGVILYANAAALPVFGVASQEEVVGRSLREFIGDAAELERLSVDIQKTLAGTAVRAERRARRPDGSTITVETHSNRIDYAGAPASVVVLRDVTEARKREEQRLLTERLATVGTLAATVAHEINNPLAFVHSNLELLAKTLATPGGGGVVGDPVEMVNDARVGVERIRRIVRAMRTLGRDSTHDAQTIVSIPTAIEAAIQLTANEIRQRARLERDLGPVPLVMADETGLIQVFVNLLANAAQAIPEGAHDHVVRIASRTSDEGDAVVEVCDDGRGMSAEELGRIFEPFFTTKRAGEGTGLGLPVVMGIVRSLGGDVVVESEPGRGSTFRVVLPAAPAQVASTPSPTDDAPAESLRRAHLLIVDDEEMLARVLSRRLAPHYETSTAPNGAVALELLGRGGVDAVLCDVMMPVMDGPTLFEEVQSRFPALAERFVFMSGGTYTPRTNAFFAKVPNAKLAKPLDMRELLGILAKLIDPA